MISTTLPGLRIVVLAAGFSRRLGTPKALARVRGSSLLRRTLATLLPFSAAHKIIVVVPPRCARYRLGLRAHTVDFVENFHRAGGQSSSVRRGIMRARYSSGVLLLPVDLVRLEARDIARLISHWRGSRRRVAARQTSGAAGSPLILPRALYSHAARVTGDQGLRDLMRELPHDRIALVTLHSAAMDIDTPHDLQAARRSRAT